MKHNSGKDRSSARVHFKCKGAGCAWRVIAAQNAETHCWEICHGTPNRSPTCFEHSCPPLRADALRWHRGADAGVNRLAGMLGQASSAASSSREGIARRCKTEHVNRRALAKYPLFSARHTSPTVSLLYTSFLVAESTHGPNSSPLRTYKSAPNSAAMVHVTLAPAPWINSNCLAIYW